MAKTEIRCTGHRGRREGGMGSGVSVQTQKKKRSYKGHHIITQWRDAPKYRIHQKWITQHKGNCYHKMAVEHYACQRVNESLGRHCRKSDYFNVYLNQYPKIKTTMGSASQHPLDVNGEARDGGTGSFKHRLAEI